MALAKMTGKKLFEAVSNLPNEERKAFWKIAFNTTAPGNVVTALKGMIASQAEELQKAMELLEQYRSVMDETRELHRPLMDELRDLRNKADRRKGKKRFTDRDKEIVRLKDVENLSFGQVKREIRKTKRWAKITLGAVKQAYHRESQVQRDAFLLSIYGDPSADFLTYYAKSNEK